jgi:hypothetical protein
VRTLVYLLLLQSLPMHMGDTFQIFAREEWGLNTKTFSSFVGSFGLILMAGNIAGSMLAPRLGIKRFSAIATLSSMCGPLGASLFNFQGFLAGSLLGFLSAGQALGTTAALVSEGAKSGVPQGELAGERSSILALLKIVGPLCKYSNAVVLTVVDQLCYSIFLLVSPAYRVQYALHAWPETAWD